MPDIFSLHNVSYSYLKPNMALDNINLSVQEGEILSVIGSNGSGKSTLLHILSGLVFPQTGTVQFNDTIFNEKSFKDPSFNIHFRSSVGFIFQNSDAQLFCPTVLDELLFGPLQLGMSKEMALERANGMMKMLNIECLADRPIYMLSGGEKKRVAIGAVLTTNPSVLLMDEPLSGLDPKTRSSIIDLIFKLNEAGKTIVITTHNLELVSHLQSRVVVMSENHSIARVGKCTRYFKCNRFSGTNEPYRCSSAPPWRYYSHALFYRNFPQAPSSLELIFN